MTNNDQDGDCYIDIRCPVCKNIRAQACDGSEIRAQCRKCKIHFCGTVAGGEFTLQKIEGGTQKPARRVLTSINPPTLTG